MNDSQPNWPNTRGTRPPGDGPYRAALWLLGRHPRLAALSARIDGVIDRDDDEPWIDLDHLAEVISTVPRYVDAWHRYESEHQPPEDEQAWYRWHEAGPKAQSFAVGLSDFLVMSSGETASLRLLAALARDHVPFRAGDLISLDAEGQRLLTDWTRAVRSVYGASRTSVTHSESWRLEPAAPGVDGPSR